MNGRNTWFAVATLLVAVGLSLPQRAAGQVSPPARIQVQTCSGGEGCQPCSQAGIAGLSFRTPGNAPATRQRVSCGTTGGPRCQDQARVEWMFQGLSAGEYYFVRLAYDPDTAKYPSPTYPFADVYGEIADNAQGPTFTVLSPAPAEDEKVWPYSVHLYGTTGGGMDLVACADPEIVIDP